MIPLPRSREDGAEQPRKRSLGIIGGLDPLASADFLLKLLEVIERRNAAHSFDIVFEEALRPRPQAAASVSPAVIESPSVRIAMSRRRHEENPRFASLNIFSPTFASLPAR